MLGQLQRIAERCIAPALAGLTLACAENLTSPAVQQQIHARVQVSSGAAAASNEIKALEEIEARQSRRGGVKTVFVSFEGTTRAFTLSSLLERARASSALKVAPQETAIAAANVPFASSAVTSTPSFISNAYTLVSSPVSSGDRGLAVATMEVALYYPSYGTLYQDVHVTTTRPAPSIPIDMHATGQGSLPVGGGTTIYGGLTTRVDVQMGDCDAIGASTSHHFHDSWSSQDYWAATADQDSPMSTTCCGSGPKSPPPTYLRIASPAAISSASAASTTIALSPASPKVNVTTCSSPTDGGGTSGGSGGGGSYIRKCLILDYYDGWGNFMYSVTVGCWTETI